MKRDISFEFEGKSMDTETEFELSFEINFIRNMTSVVKKFFEFWKILKHFLHFAV